MQHRNEVQKTDNRLVHSVLYQAGPNTRKFVKVGERLNASHGRYLTHPGRVGITDCIRFEEGRKPRFLVDYQELNAGTIWDSYLITCMDDCTNAHDDSTIFITSDTNRRYWFVETAEDMCNKTAFMSDQGLYQFIEMPFWSKNAFGTV